MVRSVRCAEFLTSWSSSLPGLGGHPNPGPAIGARIERYVASGAGGALQLDEMQPVEIEGVPFALLVRREAVAPGSVFLMRSAPPDIREQRIRVMRDLIEKKAAKMDRYRERGWRTMLVIETDDYVLINRYEMPAEFREAAERTAHAAFDDVALILTWARWCVVPLKIAGELRDEAELFWPRDPGYPALD